MTFAFNQFARNTLIGSAMLATTSLAAPVAFADTAYTTSSIEVAHRDRAIKLDIYYPVENGAVKTLHGKNLVFQGVEISTGTKPLKGKHPVVIFSHGSGGNGINTGWFAKALADQGIIVIAPNHPGSTSRDSDPEQSLKTWERPQDMSAILDQLTSLLPKGLEADDQRVAAAGFSLGGYSVLSLAGATIRKEAFIDYCKKQTEQTRYGLSECAWFTHTGFELETIAKAGFERNNLDPRFKAVVSIDPGFAVAFNDDSLAKIDMPVKIINLGTQDNLYPGVNGKPIAAKIPGAQYAEIPKAWHFDFLAKCTGFGPIFLAVTFDDPICSEPNGGDRETIQRQTAAETLNFLTAQFALTN